MLNKDKKKDEKVEEISIEDLVEREVNILINFSKLVDITLS